MRSTKNTSRSAKASAASPTFRRTKPVIHCTLSVVRITELQDALELVFQNDVFTQAEVTALEIYTYPMRLIKRFDLTRA